MVMRSARYFSGKNILVFILVAYAFYYLYKYRQNDPPPLYTVIPNFEVKALDGYSFHISDIKLKKIIIFFNKKNIFSTFYKKNLAEIVYLAEKNNLYLIVFVKTKQDKNSLLKYVSDKSYKLIEKHLYLTNIKNVEKVFGINSWPFMVILDENNRIIYAAKVPVIKEIKRVLRGE
ncbi:TlpA family protein disulfide reductase [Deferribacter abyssi]|uniref:TlpA family protein disulfide reductase n=1 Tax=Deferribacter abyssi TaxID=213806 RepID=UPI003C2778F0